LRNNQIVCIQQEKRDENHMARRNRLVSFGRVARVKLVLHINDFTQEERKNSWYTRTDMEGFEIDSRTNKTVLFSSIASARRVLRRCDYTQDEDKATWYTREEILRFEQACRDEQEEMMLMSENDVPELREESVGEQQQREAPETTSRAADPLVDASQPTRKNSFGVTSTNGSRSLALTTHSICHPPAA
jgi:hypothetical protein